MIEFLSQYSTYVVLVTILVLWAGLATYLMRLDTRVKRLEVDSRH